MAWIYLLTALIFPVQGAFVAKVAQTSYQAEENHNVTLEWTFTTSPDTSSESIFIYCSQITDETSYMLFYLKKGEELSEFQEEQFSGRVRFDRDVLREGRVRLQLSRLRTDDSGLYRCKISTDDGWSSAECSLVITAATQSPTQESQVTNTTTTLTLGLGLGLWLVLGLVLVLGLAIVVGACLRGQRMRNGQNRHND